MSVEKLYTIIGTIIIGISAIVAIAVLLQCSPVPKMIMIEYCYPENPTIKNGNVHYNGNRYHIAGPEKFDEVYFK